jgi:hypothetical protein
MIIINFAHPFTDDHLHQISMITGEVAESVIDIDSNIDTQEPLAPQAIALIDEVNLSKREWQTLSILINLPSLNYIAAVLISEIHGRCGYFPTIIRMRPVKGASLCKFEVAEIIDLQALRCAARARFAIQTATDATDVFPS